MRLPKRWMDRKGNVVMIEDMSDDHIENVMKDLEKGIKSSTVPKKYNFALSKVTTQKKPTPIKTVSGFQRWARYRLRAFRQEQRHRGLTPTVGQVRV